MLGGPLLVSDGNAVGYSHDARHELTYSRLNPHGNSFLTDSNKRPSRTGRKPGSLPANRNVKSKPCGYGCLHGGFAVGSRLKSTTTCTLKQTLPYPGSEHVA